MEKKKIVVAGFAWGGDENIETLLDLLVYLKKAAPSAMFAPVLGDFTTGGWPTFEIEIDLADADSLAEAMDLEVSDLLEMIA